MKRDSDGNARVITFEYYRIQFETLERSSLKANQTLVKNEQLFPP